MDQRTSDVEEDLKDILRTRMALADKLQLLEQRIEEKVQGTRTAAMDVISHAKNTAMDFVESTAQKLDLTAQAGRRPWLLVGGAIAVGFLAGWMEQRRKGSGVYAYYPQGAQGADVMPPGGGAAHERGVYPYYPAQTESPPSDRLPSGTAAEHSGYGALGAEAVKQVSSLWQDFTGQFARERERLQAAAQVTARQFLQDVAHIAVQSLIDALAPRPQTRPSRSEPTRGNIRLAG